MLVALEVMRHRLVGQQHELFDEAMRDVALVRDDVLDQPLFVEHDLRLGQVEVDRPAAAPPRVQDVEQLAHQLEASAPAAGNAPMRLGVAIGQDGVDGGVGHPLGAVDHAVVHLVAHDVAASC